MSEEKIPLFSTGWFAKHPKFTYWLANEKKIKKEQYNWYSDKELSNFYKQAQKVNFLTTAQQEKQGKLTQKEAITLKGKKTTLSKSLNWFNGIRDRWTKDQIKDLQIKMGMENPNGVYDANTMTKHMEWLVARESTPKNVLDTTERQNLQLYNVKQQQLEFEKAKAAEAEHEARAQLARERAGLRDEMYNRYYTYFGAYPTVGSLQQMANQREHGKGFYEFDREWRRNPEFKKANPGITDNLSIEDYQQLHSAAVSTYIQNRGRPPEPHEIADMLHGRKLKPLTGGGETPNFQYNNYGGI